MEQNNQSAGTEVIDADHLQFDLTTINDPAAEITAMPGLTCRTEI